MHLGTSGAFGRRRPARGKPLETNTTKGGTITLTHSSETKPLATGPAAKDAASLGVVLKREQLGTPGGPQALDQPGAAGLQGCSGAGPLWRILLMSGSKKYPRELVT